MRMVSRAIEPGLPAYDLYPCLRESPGVEHSSIDRTGRLSPLRRVPIGGIQFEVIYPAGVSMGRSCHVRTRLTWRQYLVRRAN